MIPCPAPPAHHAEGTHADLAWLLARLPAYLKPALRRDARGRRYFGSGDAGEDCIRSNSSICFALAVLAERCQPPERTEHLTLLTDLLGYLCAAHRTGTGTTARGGRWGLEWQSSWWAAKLALGARLVRPHLPADLCDSIDRVIAAEADRHLTRDAPTGLFRDTKAEETAWDAEALAAAVTTLPTHPNAGAWRSKLIEFLANTFSTPQDRTSDAVLDTLPVRDLVYTCNLHADFTLENHGSCHFCYVASCLLSKASTAHAFHRADLPAPDALRHGVDGVWSLAARTFLTNRFAYIAGQDWARYAYGEYFIIPAAAWLGVSRGDPDAWTVLHARTRVLRAEAPENPDGSFFGRRFTAGIHHGQMGKYETDCFACVALALQHLPARPQPVTTPPRHAVFTHISPESQTCFHRSPRGFFSFSWTSLKSPWPMMLLIPAADDSLAEWREGNGLVTVTASGLADRWGVGSMRHTGDRIVITGEHFIRGRRHDRLLTHDCRVEYDTQTAVARVRSSLRVNAPINAIRAEGLAWCVPNDRFNHGVRVYHTPVGSTEFRFDAPARHAPAAAAFLPRSLTRKLRKLGFDSSTRSLRHSPWINVDDRIGFIALNGGSLCVRRTTTRQAPWSSLHADIITTEGRSLSVRPRPGTVLCETEVLIHLGTAEETRRLAANSPAPSP